eukprot:7065609-Lingulodinium_polyedra.AAC.1
MPGAHPWQTTRALRFLPRFFLQTYASVSPQFAYVYVIVYEHARKRTLMPHESAHGRNPIIKCPSNAHQTPSARPSNGHRMPRDCP